MRTNANVQPGQLWRASDPRRLRLLKVLAVNPDCGEVLALRVYPRPQDRQMQVLGFHMFMETGTKGLVRVQ